MLRCLAGICGGAGGADVEVQPRHRQVYKPVKHLSEGDVPEAASFDDLKAGFSMSAGPPGSQPPVALVTDDFMKNTSRLLVLLPSPGSADGAWDPSLPGKTGQAAPLIRWAKANGYAVALFSAKALQERPAAAWDSVVKGCPARYVGVAVAGGAMPILQAALAATHALLYSRFRGMLCAPELNGASAGVEATDLPPDLQKHLKKSLGHLPASWAELEDHVAHEQLFELLGAFEERWSASEARKFTSFQGLKENDMPGLKRISADERIARLDRDRNKDELARLLHKHTEEDEPGVD